MRAIGVSITGALLALALCAPSALSSSGAGLEPGVHVDPGSPAAKEYSLPLNRARGTGRMSASHESSPESALFGAGIKPPRSGDPGGPRGAPGSKGSPRAGARGRAGRGSSAGLASGATIADGAAGQAALPPAVLRAAHAQGSGGGGDSLLALLAGGVAIIVLGGFGGTVLRHSRRPTPSG